MYSSRDVIKYGVGYDAFNVNFSVHQPIFPITDEWMDEIRCDGGVYLFYFYFVMMMMVIFHCFKTQYAAVA